MKDSKTFWHDFTKVLIKNNGKFDKIIQYKNSERPSGLIFDCDIFIPCDI